MLRLEDALPMILNRTLDGVMPPYRELFRQFDITEQQWRILRVLWAHERVTSAQLSSQALIPAPSLVGVIDRLEKKGLVSRIRSVEDRRVVFVMASAKGRALEQEVSPLVGDIHQQVKRTVSDQEWDVMVATLDKIEKAMQSTTQDAAVNG